MKGCNSALLESYVYQEHDFLAAEMIWWLLGFLGLLRH